MHTRQVRLCASPAGIRSRYTQAKRKKMKLLKSILLLILIYSCNGDEIERIDYQYSTIHKRGFLSIVHKGYQKDGKYFLTSCSRFFQQSGKEIKIGDSFNGMPDHHFGIQYTICLLYTSPSPRDRTRSRMPSSA